MTPTTPWILTYTGQRVSLTNPDPSTICVEDIAHALARVNRFVGHTAVAISVAQHCVHTSLIAPPGNPPVQRACLLHDAHEAYLGDLTTPLKRVLGPAFARLDRMWRYVISLRYGVDIRIGVDWWDRVAMLTERRAYGPGYEVCTDAEFLCSGGGGFVPPCDPGDYIAMSDVEAEIAFLDRFYDLEIEP